MDDIRQTAIDRFRAYLERRQFSAHTVASYTIDFRLFFAEVAVPLAQLSYREVEQFVEQQHQQGHAWATINRRLYALKHFCDFCLTQHLSGRQSRQAQSFCPAWPSPPQSALTEQVQRLFAQITHPMDRALFLVILRCGLRVSEVAPAQARSDRLGAASLVHRAGQRAKGSTCVYVARCGSECPTVSGAASGRPGTGLCFLEPQTAAAAAVGQSDPKEDGALRQGRGHHRKLP